MMRRGFARMITKPAIYLEVPARPIGISEIRALIIANYHLDHHSICFR
ncbi:MAG: hypothetical protein OXC02_11110 [Rhodobacteraceae bacterium]|nr:hypothetical protein [Paracoccaceae bacterium]